MLQVHNDKVPLLADEKGTLRVGGTRVSLSSVIARYDQGLDAEQLVRAFPSLELADVHVVLGYFLRHEDEVRAALDEEQHQAKALQREIEAQVPGVGQTFPRTKL